MSASKVSFSVLPKDSHRLIIEIQDAAGTWQMPIARDQAKLLAKQLTEMSELTEEANDGRSDLKTFTEHSMVKMPGGVLWMGAMPETEPTSDAMPRHRVDVDAFELSAIVVTQGLWSHVMGSNPSTHTGSLFSFAIDCQNGLGWSLYILCKQVLWSGVEKRMGSDYRRKQNGNLQRELVKIYRIQAQSQSMMWPGLLNMT